MFVRLRRLGDTKWNDYEMDSTTTAQENTEPSTDQSTPPVVDQSVDMIDMNKAVQHEGTDFRTWNKSTKLTSIYFTDSGLNIHFGNKDTNPWPDVVPNLGTPQEWDGPIYYSIGMGMLIDGVWHVAAPIQCWHEDKPFGGPPGIWKDDQIKRNWFYAYDRWGDMCRQPNPGDDVAWFVIAGSVRLGSEAITVRERSNVVIVPFPDGPSVWRA